MTTIDTAEVAKFEAIAQQWWDPQGKFRPLHQMNPVRLDYITRQIAAQFARDLTGPAPFKGLRILDIGCGGGLVAEPMARLGADVVGADAAAGNIAVARLHAQQSGLEIDYRACAAEDLEEDFDVVLALEIIEHVSDPQGFLDNCRRLMRPGGLVIASTLNRTPTSFAAAIVGAEWVMRWLPRGTHDWSRFIRPTELGSMFDAAGVRVVDRGGMVFNPLGWSWSLSKRDLSVNYLMTGVRQ